MTVVLTYKFRLRDAASSELLRQSRAVNFVWNYCNDMQKHALKWGKKWPGKYDLQKATAGSSKELDIHAHTIQQVCHQYERSRKQHHKAFLRYRGRKSLGWVPFNAETVFFRGGAFWFRGREYKAWVSRKMEEGSTFGAGSFNQDSRGRWYINLPVKVDNLDAAPSGAIGVDLGLKDIANLSDGSKIENPRWYRAMEQRIATAQRAKKKKQGKTLAAKVANQRKDFLHKASSAIATANNVIVVGDVSSGKLSRTNQAKSVLDAGWYSFKQQLRYKAIRHGGRYVEVSEVFTTQACSQCGSIEGPKGLNGLGIREWTCSCGATHDRDTNSAKNILRRGLATLVEEAGLNGRSSQYIRSLLEADHKQALSDYNLLSLALGVEGNSGNRENQK